MMEEFIKQVEAAQIRSVELTILVGIKVSAQIANSMADEMSAGKTPMRSGPDALRDLVDLLEKSVPEAMAELAQKIGAQRA